MAGPRARPSRFRRSPGSGPAPARLLRRHGITARKTVDVIIATFCIRNGHVLLQANRDFAPMAKYLGLGTL
jgi:predicted nucleic acid-binding protein